MLANTMRQAENIQVDSLTTHRCAFLRIRSPGTCVRTCFAVPGAIISKPHPSQIGPTSYLRVRITMDRLSVILVKIPGIIGTL